jgi:hypothetical protein
VTCVAEVKACIKCGTDYPLADFPQYRPGKRRNQCKHCTLKRQHFYASPEHKERLTEQQSFRVKPVSFNALYGRGTRCWCCRRNSRGQMLCIRCRGER